MWRTVDRPQRILRMIHELRPWHSSWRFFLPCISFDKMPFLPLWPQALRNHLFYKSPVVQDDGRRNSDFWVCFKVVYRLGLWSSHIEVFRLISLPCLCYLLCTSYEEQLWALKATSMVLYLPGLVLRPCPIVTEPSLTAAARTCLLIRVSGFRQTRILHFYERYWFYFST